MNAREAVETAYLLGNGSGKQRMTRNIGAREKLDWRLLFVSAGEATLADYAQAAGEHTKAGAEVRLLNIEADAGARMGLFENIHGAPSADVFARRMQDGARRFYGAPLRPYLGFITENRTAVERTIRDIHQRYPCRLSQLRPGGRVRRGAKSGSAIRTHRGGGRVGNGLHDLRVGPQEHLSLPRRFALKVGNRGPRPSYIYPPSHSGRGK